MVRKPDGSLRLLSLMERERLMGLPVGYASQGLSQKLTMDEAFKPSLGTCILGNSFNVYAITLLLHELFLPCQPVPHSKAT